MTEVKCDSFEVVLALYNSVASIISNIKSVRIMGLYMSVWLNVISVTFYIHQAFSLLHHSPSTWVAETPDCMCNIWKKAENLLCKMTKSHQFVTAKKITSFSLVAYPPERWTNRNCGCRFRISEENAILPLSVLQCCLLNSWKEMVKQCCVLLKLWILKHSALLSFQVFKLLSQCFFYYIQMM